MVARKDAMGLRRGAALLVAAMLAAGWARVASAVTFTVNSTADAVDASPGDGVCATSGGKCTLRAAVQEANALAGADVIQLPAGVFRLTLTGIGEDLAATGDLDVTQDLQVNGAGRDATVIDGLTADRVFDVKANVTFGVSDLTIRNGDASGSTGGGVTYAGPGALTLNDVHFTDNTAAGGAGVFVANGGVTITNCVFDGGTASSVGGAVYQAGTGASAISGSTFTDDRAPTGTGGALFIGTSSTVSIQGSTFTDTSSSSGGAIFLSGVTDVTVANVQIQHSVAIGPGGGLFVGATGNVSVSGTTVSGCAAAGPGGGGQIATSGSVTVAGSHFDMNTAGAQGGGLFVNVSSTNAIAISDSTFDQDAGNSSGGGLFAASSGNVTLTNVEASHSVGGSGGGGVFVSTSAPVSIVGGRFVGDTAEGPGGGMFVSTGGNVTIDTTTAEDDAAVAAQGGGAFLSSGGSVTIQNSTFSDSRATTPAGNGGGLFASASVHISLTNSTVAGNTCGGTGGGFFVGGSATITNATIDGNAAGNPTGGGGLFNPGVAVTVSNTILSNSPAGGNCGGAAFSSGGGNIDDGATCAFAGAGDQSNTNPQLGALGDNGGPTPTEAPAPGSPAIDHGQPGPCPAQDQRGVARPADGNGDGTAVCDVGAVEFVDQCPNDPAKTLPGICGCGVADTDANGNGVADCLINAELKARIARALVLVGALDGSGQGATTTELDGLADGFVTYVQQNGAQIKTTSAKLTAKKLLKLAKAARKSCRAAAKKKGHAAGKAKGKATKSLNAFDAAVAPQS
jgi:CSLREA domain-containing protein